MSLTFLQPGFLAALVAVAAPVWLHLQRREPPQPKRLPTLRFLEATPVALPSPRRLREWPLLLLRILALVLAVTAFALPFLRGPDDTLVQESRVYLLDNTLSHRAGGALDRMRERVAAEIRATGREVQVAVVELGAVPKVLSALGEDKGAAAAAVEGLQACSARGSFGDGMRLANALLGGALMMGGVDTFDSSWRGTRLEQLLPVFLSPHPGVTAQEKPFKMQVLPEALPRPVFSVSETRPARQVWDALPTFLNYGRFNSAKPGAQIWAEHPVDRGPAGRRILMATQRFGAGITAVLGVQNFWRWRLAEDAQPDEYDRFWRQLFRYLASADREQVLIQCLDAELKAPMDVRVAVSAPASMTGERANQARKPGWRLSVEDPLGQVLLTQDMTFESQPVTNAVFRAERAGLYRVAVRNPDGETVSTRALDVPESYVELERTARNMGGLAQWAAAGEGFALKQEDCPPAAELLRRILEAAAKERNRGRERTPILLRWWMLALGGGALVAEWMLRKRWNFS